MKPSSLTSEKKRSVVMRKVISLFVVMVLCLGIACPVFAATNTFVPSISYKDGPEIVAGEPNGGCLIVTTIPQAEDKTTDIYQEDRDLLLDVYKQLDEGTMKLPVSDDYVVRDLVDVSWRKNTCVEAEHGHKQWLEKEDTQVKVTFDMGINKGAEMIVLVYLNEEWVPAKSVTNNGDGTLTVEFEDICPVAFCINRNDITEPPKTGDDMGQSVLLFAGLMISSVIGMIVLFAVRRKKRA